MSLKVGTIGGIIAIDADFDLSGNTGLELVFTKPDLSKLTVTKATGVTAPAISITDPVTGEVFQANTYWQYITIANDIDQAGTWEVQGRYIDATPKDFCGDRVTFTVDKC